MRLITSICALSVFSALAAAPALAGPPLICHSLDIGTARSLPWLNNGSWNGADPAYDVSRLTGDALALLRPGVPIIARMETLRRAVIYSAREADLTDRLAMALMARAMNSGTEGRPDPTAWFDAGYYVETVHQAARIFGMLHGPAQDAWMLRSDVPIDGLAWIRAAVRLGDTQAEPIVAIVDRARAERR